MQATLAIYGSALFISAMLAVCGIISLFKQKIYKATDNATEIEVPLFGKMKSNYPAAIFAFLGVALATFSVSRWPVQLETVAIRGTVTLSSSTLTGRSGLLVFVTGETRDMKVDIGSSQEFTIAAPRDWNTWTVFGMSTDRPEFDVGFNSVVDPEAPVDVKLVGETIGGR